MLPQGALIAGASLIGAVTSLYSAKQQQKTANKQLSLAREQFNKQLEFYNKQFDFAKEQFNWYKQLQEEDRARWESIYGPIESNLSSFYSSLTPEQFAMPAVSQLRQALANVRDELAQKAARGQLTEGAAAQLQSQAALTSAEQVARVQAAAPLQVAAAQQSFLGLQPAPRMTSNPYAMSVMNALTQAGGWYGQQGALAMQNAQNAALAANQAWQGVGQALVGGLSSYIGLQQQQAMLDRLRLIGGTT